MTDDIEAAFDLSNLAPDQTGLRFIVWIAVDFGYTDDVRVYISHKPHIRRSELVEVAIRPEVRVVGGTLSDDELELLKRWVELNFDVLVAYWDGEIEGTMEAMERLRAIGG